MTRQPRFHETIKLGGKDQGPHKKLIDFNQMEKILNVKHPGMLYLNYFGGHAVWYIVSAPVNFLHISEALPSTKRLQITQT